MTIATLKTMVLVAAVLFLCTVLPLTVLAQNQSGDAKFESYRQAILKEHGIDIKDFKGRLTGGRADGKALTKYDLSQLLMGIKVELEHTTDKMTALEISTDHLEEIPDYYTRLLEMEEAAEKEMEQKAKKAGK